MEGTVEDVVGDVVGGKELSGFGGDLTSEVVDGVGVFEIASEKRGDQVAPMVQTLTIVGEVGGGVFGIGEVGEEESLGMKGGDGVEGGVPEFDVDVGRGSGRENETMAADGDAGGVADESDGFSGIEEGDVMRGVARSVKDL